MLYKLINSNSPSSVSLAVVVAVTLIPLAVFGVLTAFFIRSFRKPEKVLRPEIVDKLKKRGRSERAYLRFWRIEMVAAMQFVLTFTVFVFLVMTFGSTMRDSINMTAYDLCDGLMIGLIVEAIVLGIAAYVARGLFLGEWKIRIIAMPQGGPPNPRSGSGYRM